MCTASSIPQWRSWTHRRQVVTTGWCQGWLKSVDLPLNVFSNASKTVADACSEPPSPMWSPSCPHLIEKTTDIPAIPWQTLVLAKFCLILIPWIPTPRNSYGPHTRKTMVALSTIIQASFPKCIEVSRGHPNPARDRHTAQTLQEHRAKASFKSSLGSLPLISTRLQIRGNRLKPSGIGITINLRHLGKS